MAWWAWLLIAVVGAQTIATLFWLGAHTASRAWRADSRRLLTETRREAWGRTEANPTHR